METETGTEEVLRDLPAKVNEIIEKGQGREDILFKICHLLKETIHAYDWVGFYFVDPQSDRELVLGPYEGAKTEHVRIPFGSGICGQAAETLATFVVDDVTTEDNYLSCSVDVKSEIVVPIMKGEKLIGELDIDSHQKSGFSDIDEEILDEICSAVAQLF